MPSHILVVGFLMPIYCLVIASAIPTAGAIDCFKCVSMNGTNAACDDPFHNNHSLDILESPCMGGRKGRDGLFPATSCIKIAGIYDDTGERITVRGCALDSGTLTTDTEIIRMSHCGRFYYDDRYVHGCLQSCSDADACNSGHSITRSHRHFHWIRGLFTSANLAAFLTLLYGLLADIGDDCCLFSRRKITGRRSMREGGTKWNRKGEAIKGITRESRKDGVREKMADHRGNCCTREDAGEAKERRGVHERGTNGKGEENEITSRRENRKEIAVGDEETGIVRMDGWVNKEEIDKREERDARANCRDDCCSFKRRKATARRRVEVDGVYMKGDKIKCTIREDRKESDVREKIAYQEGKFGTREAVDKDEEKDTTRMGECVNKMDIDGERAGDSRKEKNTSIISGNNCNRSVNKEERGKERRGIQIVDKRVHDILRENGNEEEIIGRREKERRVNKEETEAMLEGDSGDVEGVVEGDVSLEGRRCGTICTVESSHSNIAEEIDNYCIFESCTDVNMNCFEETICELKKYCNFLEVRDNCKNFCKGPNNCSGFHDSRKVPTNFPGFHNDCRKLPTNHSGFHNDSRKVPTDCPGFHNDSCKVPTNHPNFHDSSSKIPTNFASFKGLPRKNNCPQAGLNPASES